MEEQPVDIIDQTFATIDAFIDAMLVPLTALTNYFSEEQATPTIPTAEDYQRYARDVVQQSVAVCAGRRG